MNTKDLRKLKTVGYGSRTYSLRFGQEVLVPGNDGLDVQFQMSKAVPVSRYWSIMVRYNGDEIAMVFRAYKFPDGSLEWWSEDFYNMRTGKVMRRKAAQNLLLDVKHRANLRSYNADGVVMRTIPMDEKGNTREVEYKGTRFLVREKKDEKGTWYWISSPGNEYWGLARSLKEVKVQIHSKVSNI